MLAWMGKNQIRGGDVKKKRLLAFGLGLIAAGAISGCSTMHTPAGNMTDIKSTDFSKSMKQGEACATYLFGLIGPFGDSSLVDAAKNGGISKVEVVDYKDGFYIFISRHCTVAHGS